MLPWRSTKYGHVELGMPSTSEIELLECYQTLLRVTVFSSNNFDYATKDRMAAAIRLLKHLAVLVQSDVECGMIGDGPLTRSFVAAQQPTILFHTYRRTVQQH